MGISAVGETPSLTGEFVGESHRVLEMYTSPHTRESPPEGPNLLVGTGVSDWKPAESQTSRIVPSWTPPPHTAPQCSEWVAPPWQIPKFLPLKWNRYSKTGIYMAQRKEQIRAPKIELRDEEIDNLSDAEFKTLVIRMLTEMVEYAHKIQGKNEGYAKWNKNIRGTYSEGKETRTQINDLEQKEEKSF